MRYYPAISILVFSLIFLACGREPTRGIKQMRRVLDSANLFTAGQEDTITGMIKELETTLGPQIFLLTVNSIGDETINEFSIRIAEKIGIGRKGFDDGILITLAIGNQQARIEVGTGLEKTIKDEIAARILREEM